MKIDPNVTVITEVGYRWRQFGISLTGGYPPLANVTGAGSLASLGSLGQIRYGPVVTTVQYHFSGLGWIKPYVGMGPVFLLIFRNKDGSVQNLRVRQSVGAAVQFGAEFEVSRSWGLFLDAKRALLKTDATALLGQATHQRAYPARSHGGLGRVVLPILIT